MTSERVAEGRVADQAAASPAAERVTGNTVGFAPPAYPYERLDVLRALAAALPGGAVDCSIGTPCDAPPSAVIDALARSGTERGYPPSIGTPQFRQAAAGWLQRRFGVTADSERGLAACVGTKEFVVSLPHYLRLRRPDLDTVLYPVVSYPSYAMGATLAGCRAVPIAVDERFRIDLSSIRGADARRAACLWVNTPGNPAGGLDNLEAAAEWGRDHDVLVASDECYAEFTWNGPARTVLQHGAEGVLAVHSLSKRSNMAGVRVGFYAGDEQIVRYLSQTRKHAGAMVPGPSQAAAVAAWADQGHVTVQRQAYLRRLGLLADIAAASGAEVALPDGGFYLWVRAPSGDAWAYARLLAARAGLVVSPGEFYVDAGGVTVGEASGQPDIGAADACRRVRIAAVQPADLLKLALNRLIEA